MIRPLVIVRLALVRYFRMMRLTRLVLNAPFRNLLVPLALLGGCAGGISRPPSLAPRAAEAIDPRLAVERPLVDRPIDAGVRARLASLVGQARSGERMFQAALGPAQRAAAVAGPAGSEPWVAAQQFLSRLQAERAPTARAVADIDSLAGGAIKARGGIGADDLAAIEEAQALVGGLDRRQAADIVALAARIGR